jgi:hypothetical protein
MPWRMVVGFGAFASRFASSVQSSSAARGHNAWLAAPLVPGSPRASSAECPGGKTSSRVTCRYERVPIAPFHAVVRDPVLISSRRRAGDQIDRSNVPRQHVDRLTRRLVHTVDGEVRSGRSKRRIPELIGHHLCVVTVRHFEQRRRLSLSARLTSPPVTTGLASTSAATWNSCHAHSSLCRRCLKLATRRITLLGQPAYHQMVAALQAWKAHPAMDWEAPGNNSLPLCPSSVEWRKREGVRTKWLASGDTRCASFLTATVDALSCSIDAQLCIGLHIGNNDGLHIRICRSAPSSVRAKWRRRLCPRIKAGLGKSKGSLEKGRL